MQSKFSRKSSPNVNHHTSQVPRAFSDREGRDARGVWSDDIFMFADHWWLPSVSQTQFQISRRGSMSSIQHALMKRTMQPQWKTCCHLLWDVCFLTLVMVDVCSVSPCEGFHNNVAVLRELSVIQMQLRQIMVFKKCCLKQQPLAAAYCALIAKLRNIPSSQKIIINQWRVNQHPFAAARCAMMA